jgi:hypothetical protein
MSEFVTLSLLIYSLLLFAVYPLVRARVDVPPSFVGVLLIVPWIASMWMVAYDAHDAAPPSPPTDFYLEPPIDALHDLIESAGNGTHMTLPKHIFNAVRTIRFDDADEAACIYYVMDPATTSWAGKAVYAVKGGIRVVCEDNYEAVVEDSMYQVNVGLTDAGALRAAEGEATWVFRTRSEQEPTGAYSYDLGRETIAYGKERTQFNVYADDAFDVGGEYRTVKSEYLGYDDVVALVKYNNVTTLNLDTLSYERLQETYERPYGSPYFYRIVAEARLPPSDARRRRLESAPTLSFEFLTLPLTDADLERQTNNLLANVISIKQDLRNEQSCPEGVPQTSGGGGWWIFSTRERPNGVTPTRATLAKGTSCLCWVYLPLSSFSRINNGAIRFTSRSHVFNGTTLEEMQCGARMYVNERRTQLNEQTVTTKNERTRTTSIVRCADKSHPTRNVRPNGLQEIQC